MKKLVFLLAVVVAFAFTAVAQDQTSTQTESTTKTTTKAKKAKGEAKAAKEVTEQGCLAAGKEPNTWMLTKGKKSFEVTSSTDLAPHVGHEVKLTGNFEKKAEAGEKKAERHFNATNVEHVADTCTATAATKPAKEKKSKKGETMTPPGF